MAYFCSNIFIPPTPPPRESADSPSPFFLTAFFYLLNNSSYIDSFCLYFVILSPPFAVLDQPPQALPLSQRWDLGLFILFPFPCKPRGVGVSLHISKKGKRCCWVSPPAVMCRAQAGVTVAIQSTLLGVLLFQTFLAKKITYIPWPCTASTLLWCFRKKLVVEGRFQQPPGPPPQQRGNLAPKWSCLGTAVSFAQFIPIRGKETGTKCVAARECGFQILK